MTNTALQEYSDQHQEHVNIAHQAFTIARAIKSPGTYQAAAAFLLKVKDTRKRWAEIIKPAVKAAHDAHVRIKDVEKMVDEPLAKAENEHLKPAMAQWEIAEESRRKEEQERLNRELQKQDDDRKLSLAVELEKSGKSAEATAVLDEPPAPELVLPKTTDVKGIAYRTRYYAEVVDKDKLICAVAARLAPMEFIEPNMKALNGVATAMKESVEAQWKEWGLALRKDRVVSAIGR